LITRRRFLRVASGTVVSTLALGGYAMGVEPMLRLDVTRYRLAPAGWPPGFKLTIAALADVHAVVPGMSVERITQICAATNALNPDITLLLGDYMRGRKNGWPVPPAQWARALATLKAPLGVHAILGNHDWWDDPEIQKSGIGLPLAYRALEDNGLSVYHNRSVRLSKDGRPFWLAGLGDQLAMLPARRKGIVKWAHLDDLPATLAPITDDAPVILMAHEPDIFPKVPSRVSLTLSGHTHGGQVRVLGYSPVVPSKFGNRYAYGHIREDGRDLIVSGGLGCSMIPVRLGVPPEILLIELGGDANGTT
jgi:uncharacterized protein